MKRITILFLVSVVAEAKVTAPQIAAYTTIAVNAPTIVRFILHPKKQSKAAAKKVKDMAKRK